MADGGSAVKQFAEEVVQEVGEVVKEVKDEVGQALEQGAQSATGTQLTPQQIQQKELERQKKLTETRREIKWYQDIETAQRDARQKEKQKQLLRQQVQEQEEQKEKMEEAKTKQLIPEPAKPQSLSEAIARTQAERGKGRGVGG